MSKKYYAVRAGRKPGIYQTWPETQRQVSGFKNAEFQSFKTLKEAENFINPPSPKPSAASDAETVTAYVDGSFDQKTNRYSFGAALIQNGQVIKTLTRVGNNPKYQSSRQIAGEVFGAIHAMHWAIKHGYKKIIIHYDYLGIEKWALGEWKANKDVSKDYIETYHELAPKIDVQFVKVKAHSGVQYNELVDQLAKDALQNEPVEESFI